MQNVHCKTGILLLNVGTPNFYDIRSVRTYLKEFLMDPRVVNLPFLIRWLLVNFIIIPFRVKRSCQAYQSIWNKGSPLLVNSQKLQSALSEKLGPKYLVALGMRYGHPSIINALNQLKKCQRILIFPLFPQYASSSTGSALEKTLNLISSWQKIPSLSIQDFFYNAAWFIDAYAQQIKKAVARKKIDAYVFSYHGLPERHLDKKKCLELCQQDNCAIRPLSEQQAPDCYRAQCYLTTQALVNACHLSHVECFTAFQSRLGNTSWIKPYTDQLLPALIKKGLKNIAIICPSFVCDCLETLEEIGIRMKDQWIKLGGGEFIVVPSLNDDPYWLALLAAAITQTL